MKVIIYVEGATDVLVLENLLHPIIARKAQQGIEIIFREAPVGDKKKTLLTKTPEQAVNILVNNADAIVIILPDLYPPNKGFPHETFDQMKDGTIQIFFKELKRRGICDDRITDRFHVFCMKHDLEVLLLAAEEALAQRLGKDKLERIWCNPVEDQNPPCRVIERLFAQHKLSYSKPNDATLILGACDYHLLADRCPQCFKPFVDFLEALAC